MGKTINTIFHNAGVHDKAWIKFLKPWILISLAVLLVTAFFTDGIYHPDEYFQTIEFANYKLGNTDSSRLAWEFPAREALSFKKWLEFTGASLLGLTVNIVVMKAVLSNFAPSFKVIAQACGIAAGMVINFILSKLFVFRKKSIKEH